MSEVRYEQLIRRRNRFIDHLYRALIYTGILVVVLSSVVIGYYGLFLAVIMGFVAYYLIFPRFSVEYEYTLFGKDLDIDIIYNKEKRKSKMQLDLSQAELIAPISSQHMAPYKEVKKVDFTANNGDKEPYGIIIAKNQSRVCVLVEMSDSLYVHLKMTVPRVLYRD